jgi:hypothetical protein
MDGSATGRITRVTGLAPKARTKTRPPEPGGKAARITLNRSGLLGGDETILNGARARAWVRRDVQRCSTERPRRSPRSVVPARSPASIGKSAWLLNQRQLYLWGWCSPRA